MFQLSQEDSLWPTIEELAARSSGIFVKKLSRNDTSWADDPGKHQAGFYVPRPVRETGFFPALEANNPDKPHIFHAHCISFWPQTGEIKRSGMRHFSNKGPETHFTTVPREVFSRLSPASLLVSGKLLEPLSDATHWFVVLDSMSDDAEVLETTLDLPADFHFDLFESSAIATARRLAVDESSQLIDELTHAIRNGTLESFIRSVSRIPPPEVIAKEAQNRFLAESKAKSLSPYELQSPGDAIMRISRDIEYDIFKRYELRRRASEAVGVLMRTPDVVTATVRGFPLLDALFLSASQQRKTRAGRSFENHLATQLRDGRISFEEQAILGGRRPDFVLPNRHVMSLRENRPFNDALILSAKTTLRERWKQITHERFNCAIFLATVDDRVSKQALDEMEEFGIQLVVPESLKSSKETYYPGHANVLSFRDFFHEEVARRRAALIRADRLL